MEGKGMACLGLRDVMRRCLNGAGCSCNRRGVVAVVGQQTLATNNRRGVHVHVHVEMAVTLPCMQGKGLLCN